MSITSFEFYIMIAVAMAVYYTLPLQHRWISLFLSGIYFIVRANGYGLALVTIGILLWAYLAAMLIDKFKDRDKIAKIVQVISVIAILGTLIIFKEQSFFAKTANKILGLTPIDKTFSVYEIVAPLGISYFALILISYVCEVYWGTVEVQKNPLKFMTYGLFFPTLTSGPILKYNESSQNILEGHKFEYKNLCFGAQRIIWGFFKKLVISDRLAILVSTVYSDYETYNGLYVPFAALLFTLQLYTDFSGCIDIVMGVSELFGVNLPENFNKPFLAKSLAEFWRRWHVTLGIWLKEFILYPILKSGLFQKIGDISKKKFGKKIGKKIPTWIGLLISWFLIGLWHGGGYNYIFGVGIYMGVVIILSEILEPVFIKLKKVLNIDDTKFSWQLFQMIRTYCVFSFGNSFFRAKYLSTGFYMWKAAFINVNLEIFVDGSMMELGLTNFDFGVLEAAILVLIVTGVLSYKKDMSVRELIAEQGVVFRWLIWLSLIFAIVIFGEYGFGYDAANFIYKGF